MPEGGVGQRWWEEGITKGQEKMFVDDGKVHHFNYDVISQVCAYVEISNCTL